MAERLRPDVILMDVSMPRLDGIEATRRIKAQQPAIRVIGLSMFDDEETASKMRDAGAEDYLSKAGPGEHLLEVVRRTETSAARTAPDSAKGEKSQSVILHRGGCDAAHRRRPSIS